MTLASLGYVGAFGIASWLSAAAGAGTASPKAEERRDALRLSMLWREGHGDSHPNLCVPFEVM